MDIPSPVGGQADISPAVNDDPTMAAITQSAAVAGLLSEPKPLVAVSKAMDYQVAIQSASAIAEGVAAYCAPLEQALGLVDSLLHAASNFADVSIFHNQ